MDILHGHHHATIHTSDASVAIGMVKDGGINEERP